MCAVAVLLRTAALGDLASFATIHDFYYIDADLVLVTGRCQLTTAGESLRKLSG